MREIKLTDEDIVELKNIINCLQSNDEETFDLGLSLLVLKLGNDFSIPVNDIYIPFYPFLENLRFLVITSDYDSRLFSIELLTWLVECGYYAVSSNN